MAGGARQDQFPKDAVSIQVGVAEKTMHGGKSLRPGRKRDSPN